MMATIQEIRDALSGIAEANRSGGAVNWQNALGGMADYARANNLDPTMIAQAANMMPGGGTWDESKVRATMAQFDPRNFQASGYGLNPSLQTLGAAGREARQILGDTQSRVSDLFKQGMNYLTPYTQTGTQANQLQAALSGALGPEAQRQAFAEYNTSPGVQFAKQQAEKALTRNAAALGGLGGGNVRDELVRMATGYAQQDFGNQFNRIGAVADRGFGASSQAAGMGPQEASIQASLGQTMAGVPMQVGGQQAGYQIQAGRDIASNVGSTTSALADLVNQQGAGTANMIGGQATNINAIYQAAANGDAQAQQQLAGLLGEINMNGAAGVAGIGQTPMTGTNYLGQLGQIGSGVAGALAGLGPGENIQPAGPKTAYNTVPGYGPTYNTPYVPPTFKISNPLGDL